MGLHLFAQHEDGAIAGTAGIAALNCDVGCRQADRAKPSDIHGSVRPQGHAGGRKDAGAAQIRRELEGGRPTDTGLQFGDERVGENAAVEPEITNLAELLISMGAKIGGIGTNILEVDGVDALHPASVETIPDRIETGTMLVACAICGGKVKIEECNPQHVSAVTARLEDAGAKVKADTTSIEIHAPKEVVPVDVTTAIYPGFPTDMQAQWIALMAIAKGSSTVTDTIYFDRFKHVPELVRLGADIVLNENAAVIRGVKKLTGAKVMSTDLRASAALILAGLRAHGETEVLRVYHLDRGYEAIEKKLQGLGADITREKGEEF